jgi:hypothetical protein
MNLLYVGLRCCYLVSNGAVLQAEHALNVPESRREAGLGHIQH